MEWSWAKLRKSPTLPSAHSIIEMVGALGREAEICGSAGVKCRCCGRMSDCCPVSFLETKPSRSLYILKGCRPLELQSRTSGRIG